MQKLLVTGASGFLGWYITEAATTWQVIGTYWHHRNIAQSPYSVPVDLTNQQAVQQLFQDQKPDAVVHAAALSQPNACQQHPNLSYKINVLAAWQIAEECARLDIPCVFTSSEQVFDGTQAPYREIDPVSPINLYGEHKALAETGMLARHRKVIVCRMPLMFGAAPTASSFIQPFIQRLRTGEQLQAFTDEIRMPLSGWDAAQGLLLTLEQKYQGILHLGGPASLSRFAMAKILVEVLGIDQANITPCKQADVQMAAPRPQNLAMDNTIALKLGFKPQDFRSALLTIRDRL
ncbi:NAD(P)-dependent oxidoreductase [filamentous cyanobacterium LEGE 11480]|uniref:dTDP-4-dehydrorhamnose reductase n=1 Tax=Romeriopsis navalis LEGE 11480 TaxID=2777977 RepID=A0A928VHV0_9CYAN|nr:NAD(P)-dependent oxidoreductase [Romeriopsis navalis]MBE9028888.1 NAD(P)-dependent oxidoreductase [Romeriopsis navalis LEGE 11480]